MTRPEFPELAPPETDERSPEARWIGRVILLLFVAMCLWVLT